MVDKTIQIYRFFFKYLDKFYFYNRIFEIKIILCIFFYNFIIIDFRVDVNFRPEKKSEIYLIKNENNVQGYFFLSIFYSLH